MRPLSEAAGQELQWQGKEEFELRAGDEVFAILHAREQGADWVLGEAADGRWALRSEHLGTDEILVITEPDAQVQLAVMRKGHRHGLFARDDDYIEFADGHVLAWHKTSAWRDDERDWVDREGSPVIHFRRGHRVVIEPLVRSLPELSLLVIAGWQLLKLEEAARKKAAMIAAVASTTGSHVVVKH